MTSKKLPRPKGNACATCGGKMSRSNDHAKACVENVEHAAFTERGLCRTGGRSVTVVTDRLGVTERTTKGTAYAPRWIVDGLANGQTEGALWQRLVFEHGATLRAGGGR